MALNFPAPDFENSLRLFAPSALMGALLILSVTALPLPHADTIKPAWLLMVVYYWSIYRPTIMPPWLCFASGLLLDLISGLPIGVHAAIFTLAQMIVRNQRRFLMGQAYITIWGVFALVATLCLFIQWTLYGMVSEGFTSIAPVMMTIAATVFLFPVVTLLLIAVHRILPAVPKTYP